jgi:hypothetical protein
MMAGGSGKICESPKTTGIRGGRGKRRRGREATGRWSGRGERGERRGRERKTKRGACKQGEGERAR